MIFFLKKLFSFLILPPSLFILLFLKKKGKKVVVGCKDKVPHFLDFLPGAKDVLRLISFSFTLYLPSFNT